VASTFVDGACLYSAAAGDGGRLTLRVPGLCDFLIDRPEATVECRLDPSADPRLVALLVSGLLVAFLLTLDGHCVLHASAVEIDGAGLAFAGPSGAGKSTLAALMCAGGGRLFTDDVLRLRMTPPVECIGGSPRIRLRPGAAWALDHFATPPAGDPTVDDRLGVTPPGSRLDCVPLSAIVLPRLSREAKAIELRPVRAAASVARLAAVARVVGWTDPEVVRTQFRALADVAAQVRVVEVTVPWRPPSPAAIVGALRRLAGDGV
jgi:hypothetical protein